MAVKKPVVLYTGSPNKLQEIVSGDTVDPAIAGLTAGSTTFAGTTDTQTLTNKTLTSPRIALVAEANGNTALATVAVASAVDYLTVTPAVNGGGSQSVILGADGADATIHVNVVPKGGGELRVNGSGVITATGTVTLTNKTITDIRLSDEAVAHPDGIIALPVVANTHTCRVRDEDGNTIFGTYKVDSQDGTYLVIRPQTVSGGTTPAIVNMYAVSSDTNASIRLNPKGTGRVQQGTGASSGINLLNATDYLSPSDLVCAAAGYYDLFSATYGHPGQVPEFRAPTVGTVYFFPFFRHKLSTLGMASFHVQTGTTVATGSNLRTAIFTNASRTECLPGTLVASSNITTAVANTNNLGVTISSTGTSGLVGGELYWIGITFDAASQMVCHGAAHPRLSVVGNTVVSHFTNPSTMNVAYTATWAFGDMTSFTSGTGGWGAATLQTNAAPNFNPKALVKYA